MITGPFIFNLFNEKKLYEKVEEALESIRHKDIEKAEKILKETLIKRLPIPFFNPFLM